MLTSTRPARFVSLGTAVLTSFLLLGCQKAVPPDAICSYEPLPASTQVISGQGGIQVLASTDAYFAVRDGANKQIASGHVNAITAVPSGHYQVVLNNSAHVTSAQSKMLTKCTTGAVLVDGGTDEYYAVLDHAAQQLASTHVGSALSLFPGDYTVRLNNSDSAARVRAGATLELKPGTVKVDVGTDEYYAILDSTSRQIASSHVGRPLGLFAGGYSVRINNSDAPADVKAGESTNVPAGSLTVHGSTDEYYAVLNNAGVQLASAHLEKPLAFIPGTYKVKVNDTTAPATIAPSVTTDIKTGAVVLQGSTDEYYAIVDSAGTQLASAHLGHPLSFVPGAYRAKLNNTFLPVKVDAGHIAGYHAGSLTVKRVGSDYYAVLNSGGAQLASKQVNQPVSLAAGKYSVRIGNKLRPATVTSGEDVVLNW